MDRRSFILFHCRRPISRLPLRSTEVEHVEVLALKATELGFLLQVDGLHVFLELNTGLLLLVLGNLEAFLHVPPLEGRYSVVEYLFVDSNLGG